MRANLVVAPVRFQTTRYEGDVFALAPLQDERRASRTAFRPFPKPQLTMILCLSRGASRCARHTRFERLERAPNTSSRATFSTSTRSPWPPISATSPRAKSHSPERRSYSQPRPYPHRRSRARVSSAASRRASSCAARRRRSADVNAAKFPYPSHPGAAPASTGTPAGFSTTTKPVFSHSKHDLWHPICDAPLVHAPLDFEQRSRRDELVQMFHTHIRPHLLRRLPSARHLSQRI